MIQIAPITALDEATLNDLTDTLCRVVEAGASIGFFAPLRAEEAQRYWRKAYQEYQAAERIILVAKDEHGRVIGSGQYAGAKSANGKHRAEVQKILVHPDNQRQGVGTKLMQALEQHALAHGRELLVLDTKQGDLGELLYVRAGYKAVGSIPGYTRTPHGKPQATVIYYKHLRSN